MMSWCFASDVDNYKIEFGGVQNPQSALENARWVLLPKQMLVSRTHVRGWDYLGILLYLVIRDLMTA